MPTIAIVNNEKQIVIALGRNLREAGYHVRAFLRTDEALEGLLAWPADLALIDKTNPPLGGIELFIRLREHTRMPIIFLSAWADDVEEELALRGMPADDYILLPSSLTQVSSRVSAVLARQRAITSPS